MMMNRPDPVIKPQRLRHLLRRLIDIYSPSGKEEEILDYLHGYLRRHGLPSEWQQVDGSRRNLLVIPEVTEIKLALIGHVDTVVAHDLDNYGYEEEDDTIWGLGAADMKSGCAAMIEAYQTLIESGYTHPPIALALVVGEEEEGDGARKLAKEYYFPWVLIGEPTDSQPCLSHYGYLEAQITTRGKRMHASLANLSQNPIDSMLRLLLKISHYLETDRPEMVYNIRELSSSKAGFAVPDRCDVWLDLHLPPTSAIGEITLEIEQILVQERLENPNFDGALRFATIHSGYEIPDKWPMIDALKMVYAKRSLAWEPQAFRSHSDANLLWAAGMKPILLGSGQLEKAHTPDESVSFKQVLHTAELYLDLMISLAS
jgi:acetylornithine deacetylase